MPTRSVRSASAARILVLSLLLPLRAAAQGDPVPELSSLQPTTAPAFVLLGLSPSAVERPQTPADLAFSVVNETQRFSTLPDNYAAEIAPYWLFPRRDLAWRQDTVRSVGASLQRTATLSFAAAQVGTTESPVTGLGFGASAFLRSGRIPERTQQRFRAIEDHLRRRDSVESAIASAPFTALQEEFGRRIVEAHQRGDTALVRQLTGQVTALTTAAREAAQDAPAFRQWTRDNVLEGLTAATPQREGLFWGVAGGAAWAFPDQVWERGRVQRMGVWTTLSYEGTPFAGSSTFTPVAVVRYLAERGDTASSTIDAGGRLVLSGATYSASVEGVLRRPVEGPGARTLYRIAGIAEYRLRPDLWISATMGRDYRSADQGSLLAQLGVRFHVTRDRYAPPERGGS
jgi:hypothetical protein